MAITSGLNSAPRTRVLYILDSFPDPHAGTETQFWLLFRALDRARFEPAILLLRPSPFLQEHVRDATVEVLDVTRLRSFGAFWKILRAAVRARRANTAVAHLFFNDVSLMFPALLRLLGVPSIVSRRDLGFWYTRANLPLLRLNARCANAVIANCQAVRRAVIEAERFSPAKVHVIYNGMSREPVPEATELRATLPSGARVLVIVANLRPLKRIADAVRALVPVGREVANVHLLIVGQDRPGVGHGSHRAELEELAKQLGVGDRVHFLGPSSNPMPVIAASEVCLLCSETEGLSNVIIEYMFAGKPTVCSDVGGNPELVQDAQTGYVVPVGDVEKLANKVVQLLTDADRVRAFGMAAAERAKALFSPHSMVAQHERLYAEIAT